MNDVTRRVLLAGAALLPASFGARPAKADDSGLFDLVAQWWRFENAVNSSEFPDEEKDDLTNRQSPIAHAIAETPAQTTRGFKEKLGVYRGYSSASMESEYASERMLASVLQDAERLARGAI